MVNDLLSLLLRASITASLSDREAFIDKIATIIEQHSSQDPESAKEIGGHIASLMEGLNNSLLYNQLFMPRKDKKLNHTLEQLTTAVEKLNTLLEEAGLSTETTNTDKP